MKTFNRWLNETRELSENDFRSACGRILDATKATFAKAGFKAVKTNCSSSKPHNRACLVTFNCDRPLLKMPAQFQSTILVERSEKNPDQLDALVYMDTWADIHVGLEDSTGEIRTKLETRAKELPEWSWPLRLKLPPWPAFTKVLFDKGLFGDDSHIDAQAFAGLDQDDQDEIAQYYNVFKDKKLDQWNPDQRCDYFKHIKSLLINPGKEDISL